MTLMNCNVVFLDLRSLVFVLEISDPKSQIPDLKSQIPNPKSEIPLSDSSRKLRHLFQPYRLVIHTSQDSASR